MARLMTLANLPGAAPRRELLPSAESFRAVFEELARGSATAGRLLAELPPARAWRMQRAFGWLLKMDLVQLE
jgi:hypothetical protein